jgi:hypothetical protein
MVRPISTRAGRAVRAGIRSLFPGKLMPHALRLFTLSRRYQTRASEGRLYKRIRAISTVIENSTGSPDAAFPAEIRKKSTAYSINGSTNVLISVIIVLVR